MARDERATFGGEKTLLERFTGTRGSWRRYEVGMWAWLLHRITGWLLVFYGFIHLWVIGFAAVRPESFDRVMEIFSHPLYLLLDLGLLGVVVFHALNGLRILLIDLGLKIPQKAFFWAAFSLAILAVGVSAPFFFQVV